MLSDDNPVVMVDDSDAELEIAKVCYDAAKLPNEWLSFCRPHDFLVHLDLVKSGHTATPALVLLDINMPVLNGFDVLKKIRADTELHLQLEVVMFTNSDAQSDSARALAAGARGCLRKPSSVSDYIALFRSFSAGI